MQDVRSAEQLRRRHQLSWIRNHVRRPALALSLITAGICIAGIAYGAVALGPEASNEPSYYRTVEIPEAAVPARELWATTLDALECFEANGVSTDGPYPASDGRNIEYAFESVPGSDSVDLRCTADLVPLQIGFALHASESDMGQLRAARHEIVECLQDAGVVLRGYPPLEDDEDSALQRASEEHGDEMTVCAGKAFAP